MKDRTDVLVLTLNLDQEIGLVEPYVKQHNYTFPVLLGGLSNTDSWRADSIPRNWLITGEGVIQTEARGFIQDWEAVAKKITELSEAASNKK